MTTKVTVVNTGHFAVRIVRGQVEHVLQPGEEKEETFWKEEPLAIHEAPELNNFPDPLDKTV